MELKKGLWGKPISADFVGYGIDFYVRRVPQNPLDSNDWIENEEEIEKVRELNAHLRRLGYVTVMHKDCNDREPESITVFNLPMEQAARIGHLYDLDTFYTFTPLASQGVAVQQRWSKYEDPQLKEYGDFGSLGATKYIEKPSYPCVWEDIIERGDSLAESDCMRFETIHAEIISYWTEKFLEKRWPELTRDERLARYSEYLSGSDIKHQKLRCSVSEEINNMIDDEIITKELIDTVKR